MENVSWFERQASWFEVSRFGAMTLMMTFLSCFGSIGAMYSIENHFYLGLIICATVTMASNAAFIAQIPAKLCLIFFYAGLILNAAIIVMNTFI